MSLSAPERKALVGFAIITAFLAVSVFEIGKRNFWFETKNAYVTHITDADGLRVGSLVTISGLRVGEVTSLDVDEHNHIAVQMQVRQVVASRIRADSVATVVRAFIIGEKRVDILPGSAGEAELANGATLPGKDSTDLTEFLSGRKLADLMGQIEALIGGLGSVVKGLDVVMGRYQAGGFDKTFTMIEPALQNFLRLSDDLIVMTKEVKTKSKLLPALVEGGTNVLTSIDTDFLKNRLAKDSVEKLNHVITPIAAREQLVDSLLTNLADLSSDLKGSPHYGKDIVQAVQELTITLKALQQTWFLEDQATAVREKQHSAKAAPAE